MSEEMVFGQIKEFRQDFTDNAIVISHTDLLAKYAPDGSTELLSLPRDEVIQFLISCVGKCVSELLHGLRRPFYLPQRIDGRESLAYLW